MVHVEVAGTGTVCVGEVRQLSLLRCWPRQIRLKVRWREVG